MPEVSTRLRHPPTTTNRPRSPSLLARQKSIGEFVREAAAFSTARTLRSESSTTRHQPDPTSEPPPARRSCARSSAPNSAHSSSKGCLRATA